MSSPIRKGVLSSLAREEKEYAIELDGHTQISRKRTTAENEVSKRKDAAHEFISHLEPEEFQFHHDIDPYMPNFLENAIFCGHLVTDLDSIAGSIGAAELYGGIPARASEVNSETKFALNLWKVETPRPIEELLQEFPVAGVCLVDHQQTSQLNPAIDVDRIVGVIDHHALQNATIVTDKPIYIDIRPWGSMSTIIAHTFLTLKRRPTRRVAGMLLCAILSDTLNLQGPTTTEWDRVVVAALVEIAGVEDIQYLAAQQFKAKSAELAGLTAEALCNGDQKEFSFKASGFTGTVGFAVVETTDDAAIMSRTAHLLEAMAIDKKQKGLSLMFLAVVNIVLLRTNLLLCGEAEQSLAQVAFVNGKLLKTLPEAFLDFPVSAGCCGGGGVHASRQLRANSAGSSASGLAAEAGVVESNLCEVVEDDADATVAGSNCSELWRENGCVMDLGNLVSRKKNLIPAITQAIKKGWAAPSSCSSDSNSDNNSNDEGKSKLTASASTCSLQGSVTMSSE